MHCTGASPVKVFKALALLNVAVPPDRKELNLM